MSLLRLPRSRCTLGGRAGVADRVPDPVGQQLDGLDEAHVLDLLEEGVHVAAFAAAEAVEVAVVGPHVKRRRLLVVERAQALHRVGPGAPQLDVVADDVLDAGTIADGGDIAIGDPGPATATARIPWTRRTRHGLSLGRWSGELAGVDTFQPALGIGRDLIDDDPQARAVVGCGVEGGRQTPGRASAVRPACSHCATRWMRSRWWACVSRCRGSDMMNCSAKILSSATSARTRSGTCRSAW